MASSKVSLPSRPRVPELHGFMIRSSSLLVYTLVCFCVGSKAACGYMLMAFFGDHLDAMKFHEGFLDLVMESHCRAGATPVLSSMIYIRN